MAKFVYETELNLEIEQVIKNAEVRLIIISPFIKLHARVKAYLKDKMDMHDLEIIVVYGKNPDNKSKSLSDDDLNFLKSFPNIEIRYDKRLHAKFFANEKTQVLSTMNLYDYSQDINIEAGIVTEYSYLKSWARDFVTEKKTIAEEQIVYFESVIKNSELQFENKPKYKSGFLNITQKYDGSVSNEYHIESSTKVQSKDKVKPTIDEGYCIRTGVKIPFDMKKPYCDKAYESWLVYKNKLYKEKYCHYSGDSSNGETSMEKPVLSKYYSKVKK
jgi:hypothetical protein